MKKASGIRIYVLRNHLSFKRTVRIVYGYIYDKSIKYSKESYSSTSE